VPQTPPSVGKFFKVISRTDRTDSYSRRMSPSNATAHTASASETGAAGRYHSTIELIMPDSSRAVILWSMSAPKRAVKPAQWVMPG
jgi:hypothetical protein